MTDGVLAYLGKGRQHLAVEIFRGRLRISYDVGNHPASNMFRWAKHAFNSKIWVTIIVLTCFSAIFNVILISYESDN